MGLKGGLSNLRARQYVYQCFRLDNIVKVVKILSKYWQFGGTTFSNIWKREIERKRGNESVKELVFGSGACGTCASSPGFTGGRAANTNLVPMMLDFSATKRKKRRKKEGKLR